MYLIRADGNAKIGAGHLMRCLTIASAMEEILGSREEILFLCADEASAELVKTNGFRARALGCDYREPEQELERWQQLFCGEKHTILVDSYYVTDTYLRALKGYGRVYLLDDMQSCTFPADAVINYNAFADAGIYAKLYQGTETECYTGSDYVPVREQFLNREYTVSDIVKNILITTGGGDVDNIARKILHEILDEKSGDNFVNYHLVIGRYSPHLKMMQEMAEKYANIHIYHDVQNMAELMQGCDLAITAGGTTIYELAAIGVPFICFSYAENQEALTEYIGARGIAGYAGAYHRNEAETLLRIKTLTEACCGSRDKREESCLRERKLIDGMGARRLAEVITGKTT